MKNREKKQYCVNGSYTVEAALIFPIIVLVLAAMLYMIFYLHDKYILNVYVNRMAQECCWLFIENEHASEKRSSDVIIQEVSKKYEPELKAQLLMLEISKSLGLCKKNILTHLYTATWRIVGEPKTLLDLSRFHTFSTVACEGEYARVHIRKWIYGQEFQKELKGGE